MADGTSHFQLPDEVVQLLQTARYLHLATADERAHPSVSLMNFSYERDEDAGAEYIIMTTKRDTKKYHNMTANPYVSMLVHGFGTPRQWTGRQQEASSLQKFLLQLNQSAQEAISATLNGQATLLQGKEAADYRDLHLQSNPSDASCYIASPDVAVIRVSIASCRISHDQEDYVERWGGTPTGVGTPVVAAAGGGGGGGV